MINSRHTGIIVKNLKRSLEFYQDFLGLEIVNRSKEESPYIESLVGIENVKLEWIKLRCKKGYIIELIQYHSHPCLKADTLNFPNQISTAHIAFTVTNIEDFFITILQKSIKFINPPAFSPDRKVKVMYCFDPDGLILELVQEIN